MNKRRIVHVISSLKVGGAETVLCDLIERSKNDFDHSVIYFHPGPNVARLQALAIPTYCIRGFLFRYDLFFFGRLLRTIHMLQPDCIHGVLWAGYCSSRIVAKIERIFHVTGYHNNVDQDGFFRNLVDRSTMRWSGALVAVSDEVKKSVIENAPDSKKYISVIKNGIDLDYIREKALEQKKKRSDYGLKDTHFIIGSVGRFVSVKNYSFLLKVFAQIHAQLPLVRLMLVGQGPEEAKLRRYAHELKIASYVTFVVGQSSYGFYPLFDCFVQVSYKEGVSMALLEAMSCSVPCVATAVLMRHAVIKQGKNGLLAESNDSQSLQDMLLLCIQQTALRNDLVKEAHKILKEEFSLTSMLQHYEALFTQGSV